MPEFLKVYAEPGKRALFDVVFKTTVYNEVLDYFPYSKKLNRHKECPAIRYRPESPYIVFYNVNNLKTIFFFTTGTVIKIKI
jgi:hypothetical protein